MSDEPYACNSCGTQVENTALTGILCQSCFDEQNEPPGSWRDFVTGPSATGLFAGLLPFVLNLTMNGLNFVAFGGGAIALICGVLGLAAASKRGESAKKAMIGAGLVLALGLFQLWRSQAWLLLS